MKKLALLALGLFTLTFQAQAAGDKPVKPEQLPQAAQQFIKTHFPKAAISYATVDNDLIGKDYAIRLENGTKVEFDSDGQWTEVDAGRSAVPQAIVPSQIQSYVKTHQGGQAIVKIEKDRRGYEIELANDLSIKFDKQFKPVDFDD